MSDDEETFSHGDTQYKIVLVGDGSAGKVCEVCCVSVSWKSPFSHTWPHGTRPQFQSGLHKINLARTTSKQLVWISSANALTCLVSWPAAFISDAIFLPVSHSISPRCSTMSMQFSLGFWIWLVYPCVFLVLCFRWHNQHNVSVGHWRTVSWEPDAG